MKKENQREINKRKKELQKLTKVELIGKILDMEESMIYAPMPEDRDD